MLTTRVYSLMKKITECTVKETAVATAHCDESGAFESCPSGRQPVVLVHGYRLRDGYLDSGDLQDDDYWEDLPSLLYTAGHAPYVFRWNTAQRFGDAARSLRQVMDNVRSRHAGKAPLIVAHSFGGLVARTYAQGLDGSGERPIPGVSELRGVVTIGTPHSGIFGNPTALDGAWFPAGGDPTGRQTARRPANFILNRCLQVSCYQAGRDVGHIFRPYGSSLNLREDFGVALNPGETIAAINYGGKAMKVPLYALLGLQRKELMVNLISICLSSWLSLIFRCHFGFHQAAMASPTSFSTRSLSFSI
jgi:pimeloyl-ACP methyl ester carboxylesterase